MVQWTYENAKRASVFSEVLVATDSEEIAKVIEIIGGKAVMTPSDLANGSLRVAHVAKNYPDMDVIVNLQGDEPFIKPEMLSKLVAPFLSGEKLVMTTLAYPLHKDKYNQAGTVKVVTDLNQDAIYFSRSPIPHYRTQTQAPVYNHMGVYAFSREFLMTYTQLPETPLEMAESLEQLRAIEHGYKIRVCLTQERTLEINTPEEYEEAQSFEYSPHLST